MLTRVSLRWSNIYLGMQEFLYKLAGFFLEYQQ